MAMDYPYTTIGCATQDGENSAAVSLHIMESGVSIDQGALTQLVRDYLAGLPGVTITRATRYSVASEELPEA
jgi:hypothetical protein